MEIQVHRLSETVDDTSRRHTGGTCAVYLAPPGTRWASLQGEGNDFALQGFAVTVRSEPWLAIEDAVGCTAHVLVGQVWITADGAPQEIIADAGTTVPLGLGLRFNVTAFRDAATVLITAPPHSRDAGFRLQERDGVRVLTVTASRSGLPASLAGTPAAIAAFFAGRSFAAARASTLSRHRHVHASITPRRCGR